MIAAYHAIISAYGFWLPNDPRGSWSNFVGLDSLYRFAGRATKTDDPRSLARKPHDVDKRKTAKKTLPRPPLRFTGRQALAIAHGFEKQVAQSGCNVLACAILPDHVHLVVNQLSVSIERFVIQMKGAAIKQLIAEDCHPYADQRAPDGTLPKCFVRGQWTAYLEPGDIERTIRYVEQNPIRLGLKPQKWRFETRWNG